MNARTLPLAIALLLGATLAACTGGARDPVLILEGTYTGTTSSSCQMALRTPDGKLVDAHGVGPSFRQEFVVAPEKGRYFAQIQCPDGKMANIPEMQFEPPRESVKLGEIQLY